MNITKVTVSLEGTINLGNYQNIKIGAQEEITLVEGDQAEQVISAALNRIRTILRVEVEQFNTAATTTWLAATAHKTEG